MPEPLPDAAKALIDEPNIAFLATLMPDGSPQVTPMWVDRDGDIVVINTALGRVKTRNMERDARVALSVVDRANPYGFASVRGIVVDVTTEGADAHIDAMAKKYLGQDTYPFRNPAEQRVIVRIAPESVSVAAY